MKPKVKKVVFIVHSPFNYTWRKAKKFYNTGERIYFDWNKDQEEIKHLLRDNQDFLRLDTFNTLDEVISSVENINLNTQVITEVSNANFEYKPEAHQVVEELEVAVEPKEDLDQDLEPEKDLETEAELVTEDLTEKEEEEEAEVVIRDQDPSPKYSSADLETYSWRKLKKLAEAEGLEYTNKEEAITELQKILK